MGVDVNSGVVRLEGFDELARKLRAIPLALAKKTLRNGLAAGGRMVRDEAKRLAPVLRSATPYRKPGTVRDAIKVRTSKAARRRGDVGVFVNVKPLKSSQIRAFKVAAAQSGRKFGGQYNPNDPYYWQWLEFGRKGRAAQAGRARVGRVTIKRRGKTVELFKGVRGRRGRRAVGALPAIRFLQRSASKFPQALGAVRTQLERWLAKTNRIGRVAP